jgi:hypothetical protein
MSTIIDGLQNVSRRLNQECFCITVDHAKLQQSLAGELGEAHCIAELMRTRPHLFSGTPVFLPAVEIDEMLRIVRAIEAVAALPAYRETVLSWAPSIASYDPGPLGVFMGYDFHLTSEGPKLIEINTNAGGAFLNARLLRAQSTCCVEVDSALQRTGENAFESAVVQMFENEWRAQARPGKPRRIAIVDDQAAQQYLYPEFLLAQKLLERHGFEVQVADASALECAAGRLLLDGTAVDLVYNRLVDFALEQPEHAALRAAYLSAAAVVTPHPRAHALFADKRNLTVLCDDHLLRSWKVSPETLDALNGIPRTVHVTADNAPQLWQSRKNWFFKPATGYGSKAVYRGDKLTKSVWADIVRGGYIAQQFVSPSERMIRIDGEPQTRKLDVRLYTYGGQVLLSAARLYQGQTTNFRTPGGGFAPLLAL